MKKFLIGIAAFLLLPISANAECLKVEDDSKLQINAEQLESLKSINFDRQKIFQALWDTSQYETIGCWATPAGNFDAQYLSVGVLQWNYGQNSIQKLMNGYRAKFVDDASFRTELSNLMPESGNIAFSDDCLIAPTPQSCKDKIQSLNDVNNKLYPNVRNEYENLFNSEKMREVQIEVFNNLIIDMIPKLKDLYGEDITPLQVKWGMDVAIQQGYLKYDDKFYFLKPDDVKTINKIYSAQDKKKQKDAQLSIIRWYSGLCGGIYQGVTTEQCNYNIKSWCAVINHGLTDEQAQMFNFTFVRSRIAQGQSGRWQANAFARRTKIIFNTGWVGKEKDALPKGVRKSGKCDKWLVS